MSTAKKCVTPSFTAPPLANKKIYVKLKIELHIVGQTSSSVVCLFVRKLNNRQRYRPKPFCLFLWLRPWVLKLLLTCDRLCVIVLFSLFLCFVLGRGLVDEQKKPQNACKKPIMCWGCWGCTIGARRPASGAFTLGAFFLLVPFACHEIVTQSMYLYKEPR